MSLFFANPLWFLGALALIPLAAHLFSRTRPRKRLFPSLVLLREAAKRVTRVRRPRDRWLLALRTLAVAALVFAFLQPWLMSEFAARRGGAKTAVIVVDASASMGYVDGTRARLAQATALAEEILNTLPANSRANVIWIRGRSGSVLPEPSPNLELLKQTLRQAVARPEAGDVQGALDQAVKQLATISGERELVIISDFQRVAWEPVTPTGAPGVKVTRVAVGSEQETNVGLGELTLDPAEPMAGQSARMVCRVRNLSGEPRRVTVFGEAGAARVSQALEVGPWSDALAIMPITFPEAGTVLLKVSASEDRFPGDDVRHALVTVRGALPVAIVGSPENATAKLWARAAGALDGVSARFVSLEAVPASGAKLVFVANWNGSGAETLRALAESGAVLILQPGAELQRQSVAVLWGNSGDEANAGVAQLQEREAPGWGLRIAAEDHPVFSLFASGAYGDPVAGRFRRRTRAAEIEKDFRPLLAFEDGALALGLRDLALPGTKRVVPMAWWNLDLSASDWPTRSTFVPFFGELLQYLAGFTHEQVSREFRPGDVLRFAPDPAVDPADVTLANDAGTVLKVVTEIGTAGAQLASVEGVNPGSYLWTAQGAILERAVINFPESESDLRRMDVQALQAMGGDVISAARVAGISELREGTPLWPWCVALAAACLLIEALLLRGLRGPPASVADKPAAKVKEVVVA